MLRFREPWSCLIVVFTVWPWMAMATAIDLPPPQPYASGVVRIGFLDTSEQAIDTLLLGTGPALRRLWFKSAIPEEYRGYGAIAPVTESCSVAVFAWSPEIVTETLLGSVNVTVGGGDSVWDGANHYPDTAVAIDTTVGDCLTLQGCFPDGIRRPAKWVCGFGAGPFSGCVREFAPGWNKIFYVTGLDSRHYKFQACSIEVHVTDTCWGREPWAVHLRWAADSAGNGLFRDATPVRERTTVAPRTALAGEYRSAFDILGRRLAGSGAGALGVRLVGTTGGSMRRLVPVRSW